MLIPTLLASFCNQSCYLHYEGTDKHSALMYDNPAAAIHAFKKTAKLYKPMGYFLRGWIYLADDMSLADDPQINQPSPYVYRELSYLGNGKVAVYRLKDHPYFGREISKGRPLPSWKYLTTRWPLGSSNQNNNRDEATI